MFYFLSLVIVDTIIIYFLLIVMLPSLSSLFMLLKSLLSLLRLQLMIEIITINNTLQKACFLARMLAL